MSDEWDCCKSCDYDYEEDCSHCGNVEVEYDCYEDIVGWDELIESEKRERRGKNKKC